MIGLPLPEGDANRDVSRVTAGLAWAKVAPQPHFLRTFLPVSGDDWLRAQELARAPGA